MILTQLDIAHFRNLDTFSLAPHGKLNLITGVNGSGKSSVLEAIQCLSTGHSFRTRKIRELISREHDALRLVARLRDETTGTEHRCGVERRRDGTTELRLDYTPVTQQAQITRLLPVKPITPDSFKLLLEGPDERRHFLDWGLFHGEPGFHDVWRSYRRALIQRNQLLKDHAPTSEIASWNEPLATAADALDRLRRDYVDGLRRVFENRRVLSGVEFPVELDYRPGWSRNRVLIDLLAENLDLHRRMKTTTDGPHRAELQLSTTGLPARQVLSRGELKSVVYLLQLAQLDLLKEATGQRAIVLCDDLFSELDEDHADALIAQLIRLDSQIFIAGVRLDSMRFGVACTQFELTGGSLKNSL